MRRDMIGERRDGTKNRARGVAFGNANAEMFFDAHRKLERVERIEAETFTPNSGKEWGVVLDARGISPLQVQLFDDQLFDFLPEISAHDGTSWTIA